MMYLYLALLLAIIALLAYTTIKKRPDNVQADEYGYPSVVNRKDFANISQDIIVISFTSETCDSCNGVWEKVKALSSENVGVANILYQDDLGKQLHKKYSIDAVPTTIVCDKDGVTLKSYIGAVSATDLWAGVAGVRGAEVSDCANH